jgi:heparan-alpha-glucosaminide N-acetyltransferase
MEEPIERLQKTQPSGGEPKRTEVSGRLASLDVFRGFDILVMVFVNYIAGMKAIPFILRHAAAEMDTYTLTDLVFPGFLFIVGVAIPLSLSKRTSAGSSLWRVLARVAVRTAGLVFLGLIQVNRDQFSAVETGLGESLWYLLAYLAVFALWTIYPKTENRRRRNLYLGLRLGAVLVLLVLVIIFRGRTEAGAIVWIQPQWWGILGQIGWAYLLCSLLYLAFGRSRAGLMGFLGLLITLNIGNHLGALKLLGAAGPVGMVSDVSCHGAIALAGVIVGTLFAPYQKKTDPKTKSLFMISFGAGLYLAAILLRPIQGISKIRATQSYALASAGLCALAFLGFYLLLDVLKIRRWSEFLRPVGANPLLAYILPDVLISVLWLLSKLVGQDLGRWLWPFAERGGGAGMLNALVVTGLILLLTGLATRWKVILRL